VNPFFFCENIAEAWLEVHAQSYSIIGLDRSLGLQEFEVPRIYGQSTLEGSKVVSLTHPPHVPTGDAPGTYFC
jgi:hypothetical protein